MTEQDLTRMASIKRWAHSARGHFPGHVLWLCELAERQQAVVSAAGAFVSSNDNIVAICKTYQRLLVTVAQFDDAARAKPPEENHK